VPLATTGNRSRTRARCASPPPAVARTGSRAAGQQGSS